MTFPDRVPEYLTQMLIVCNQVQAFRHGRSESDFRNDTMLQYATLKALEVLGEAAVRIRQESPTFIKDRSLIEFNLIIGLRNRLAHEYDDLDLTIVWNAVVEAVPALRERILTVLYDMGQHPDVDSLKF